MSGTDPDYISAMEHFESMRHEDIYQATQQIDAGEILRLSGTWMHAAATLQSVFPVTRSNATVVISEAEWEGEAADAALACARSFADSIEELAGVVGQVGVRLGAVAAAAEAVKVAVVPPGNTGPVGALARLLEAAHVMDADMAQEILRQEAILTMNMVYKPAYHAAGSGVPALPEPPPLPGPTPSPAPPLGTPEVPPAQPSAGGSAPDTTQPGHPNRPDSPAPAESAPAPESRAPELPGPNNEAEQTPSAPQAPQSTDPETVPAPPQPELPTAPEPPGSDRPPTAEAPPEAENPGPPAPPPGQASSEVPLDDPAGQPGITGPVPGQRAPDQPGVIPAEQ